MRSWGNGKGFWGVGYSLGQGKDLWLSQLPPFGVQDKHSNNSHSLGKLFHRKVSVPQ